MLTEWWLSSFSFSFLSSSPRNHSIFLHAPDCFIDYYRTSHINTLVADTSGPVASTRLHSTPRRLIYSRPAKRTVTYIMITSCITPKLADIINNIIVVLSSIPANLSSLLTITRALLGFSRGSYLFIIGKALPRSLYRNYSPRK